MALLRLLWRESPFLLLISVIASLVTALLMLALVSLLSSYLGRQTIPANWWEYLGLAVVTCSTQILANVFISSLAQKTARKLRFDLVDNILSSPLKEVEETGSPTILTSMTDDCAQIIHSPSNVVALTRDMTFMIVCLLYLAWLSYMAVLIIVVVIVVGALIHRPLQNQGMKYTEALRTKEETLFGVLKNIVDGFKQLKLNRSRAIDIQTTVDDHQIQISRLSASSLLSFAAANAFAVLLFLTLIEIMMFGGLRDFADPKVLTTYTLTLIFLLGPLQTISNSAQNLGRASVALGRIQSLGETLRTTGARLALVPSGRLTEDASRLSKSADTAWKTLTLAGVTHSYGMGEQAFQCGPIDLHLSRGESLFVVGGNGSGKTTFGKLITGLYSPERGTISVDGVPIGDAERDWYRQQFGAVFADFCLFEGLAGTTSDRISNEHIDLIRDLRLDHIIDLRQGLLTQARSFSSGERRRVAMLLACLESKPAYVFDEFAADQDPECKELFYHQIVGRLCAAGKLVVVITHDSRYFGCADNILTLERGLSPCVKRVRLPALVRS